MNDACRTLRERGGGCKFKRDLVHATVTDKVLTSVLTLDQAVTYGHMNQ